MEWLIEFVNVKGEYNDVINWLIDNIEDVRERQTSKEHFGRPKPYHFSSISQFARFRGVTDMWYLEIQGTKQKKTVRFSDNVSTRKIAEFALKYTYG